MCKNICCSYYFCLTMFFFDFFCSFFIEKIKYYSRRLVEAQDLDIEDYEEKISQVQRNLMQSDYADLYLQNTLNGVDIMKLLRSSKKGKIIEKIIGLLKKGSKANKEIYKLLDPMIEEAYTKKNRFGKKLADKLFIMIEQAKMRGTKLPIYNVLIHSIEFEEDNIRLKNRHSDITKQIDELLKLSKRKFSKADAKELEISYKMARNFTIYKDVMGEIDNVLLPLWFDLLGKVVRILQKTNSVFAKLNPGPPSVGPGEMFYGLAWFLPDELKIKVYTTDLRPFSLKDL